MEGFTADARGHVAVGLSYCVTLTFLFPPKGIENCAPPTRLHIPAFDCPLSWRLREPTNFSRQHRRPSRHHRLPFQAHRPSRL